MSNGAFIVAELSGNHGGSIRIAKETIKAIKECGADAVKVQTLTPDTMTIDSINDYFKINSGSLWDGKTLYDLYKEIELPWEWHTELRDYANDIGLVFFSTPFDKTAVDFLEAINNPIYKIASFEITDIPLIKYAAEKGKPMIISTGIGTIQDIHDAVDVCRSVGNNDITLLKTTSSYPAPIESANLNTMVNMKQTFDVNIGISDHSMGHSVAAAGVSLGAKVIEKHFIIDRAVGGPDASFSMVPSEFKEMVKLIRDIEKSLGKVDYSLTDEAKKNRIYSRSLFVVEDIKKGEIITTKNVRSIRPGHGISPKYYESIIGFKVNQDISKGTPLKLSHIDSF